MENKYYTPGIEDFHEDYHYEEAHFDETLESYTNKWEKYTYDVRSGLSHDSCHSLASGHIRTKYLDKEDIKSLGWNYQPDMFLVDQHKNKGTTYEPTHFWFTLNGYGLTFNEDKTIQITDDNVHYFMPIIIYQGACLSINELKTLMKMLKIC